MSIAGSHRAAAVEQRTEPTLGRLVADASRDISSLVQGEIALAKSELKVSLTAGLVARLLAASGWERPWDTTVVRGLPTSGRGRLG